jgi:hypothetical protein
MLYNNVFNGYQTPSEVRLQPHPPTFKIPNEVVGRHQTSRLQLLPTRTLGAYGSYLYFVFVESDGI